MQAATVPVVDHGRHHQADHERAHERDEQGDRAAVELDHQHPGQQLTERTAGQRGEHADLQPEHQQRQPALPAVPVRHGRPGEGGGHQQRGEPVDHEGQHAPPPPGDAAATSLGKSQPLPDVRRRSRGTTGRPGGAHLATVSAAPPAASRVRARPSVRVVGALHGFSVSSSGSRWRAGRWPSGAQPAPPASSSPAEPARFRKAHPCRTRSSWTATPATTTSSPCCWPSAAPRSTCSPSPRSPATRPSRRSPGTPGRHCGSSGSAACRSRPAASGRWCARPQVAADVHGESGLDGVDLPEPVERARPAARGGRHHRDGHGRGAGHGHAGRRWAP